MNLMLRMLIYSLEQDHVARSTAELLERLASRICSGVTLKEESKSRVWVFRGAMRRLSEAESRAPKSN